MHGMKHMKYILLLININYPLANPRLLCTFNGTNQPYIFASIMMLPSTRNILLLAHHSLISFKYQAYQKSMLALFLAMPVYLVDHQLLISQNAYLESTIVLCLFIEVLILQSSLIFEYLLKRIIFQLRKNSFGLSTFELWDYVDDIWRTSRFLLILSLWIGKVNIVVHVIRVEWSLCRWLLWVQDVLISDL